jgi:hypothetical protein
MDHPVLGGIMTNLTESAQWPPGVYEFTTDDLVQGGPDGIDNLPTSQLANRTLWLRRILENAVTALGGDAATMSTGSLGTALAQAFLAITNSIPNLTNVAYLDRFQIWKKAQRSTAVTITDASPAIDLSASNVFVWSLGGNRTLPVPTNSGPCQSGVIWVTPNGFSLIYSAFWHPIDGVLPVFPTVNTASALAYETSPDGTFAIFKLAKGGL